MPDHAPRHPVLHGVSFRAEPGQLVALVGPSGAGKTTISQLVPRIYDADSGSIRIGGVDVKTPRCSRCGIPIGVVAQDAHMFHDTIRANLLYAKPDATEAELIGRTPVGADLVVGFLAPRGARHSRRRSRASPVRR